MLDHPKPNKSVHLNGIRFDSTIPPGAKILFAEFCAWAEEGKSFPYETKRLAEMYNVSSFTIRKWIRTLVQHNLINLHIDLSKGHQQKHIKVNMGC